MGFKISESETSGSKQHLNLSEFAWHVIYEDIKIFSNGDRHNVTGFLNRVFSNFYYEADATISQRIINRNDELEEMFSSSEFKAMEKKTTELYISKILKVYEKELVEKAYSYENGVQYKFRINKANVEILQMSSENAFYPYECMGEEVGKYLKAVFEEYALKPMFEREQIYFKDSIEEIKSAISQHHKIKLTILKKIDPKSKKAYKRTFLLSPYKIVQDKVGMYNYVIGYSEEMNSDGTLSPKREACYRISRIEHMLVVTSKGGFISQGDKERLEKMITEKEPQFLTGELTEIRVRFTDKGIESFNRFLYMRPFEYSVSKEDPHVYIFNCTEMQAINYFFKFAADAEILSPQSTREKFIRLYRDAYLTYTADSEEKN